MRFVTGLVIGVAVGYAAAKRMYREDPVVVTEPTRIEAGRGGASRLIAEQGRRLAERAQLAGIEAIHRARQSIQSRVEATDDPTDPTWN